MILHQQLPHPDATLDPWLALHCEYLSLAFCDPQGDRIFVTPLINQSIDWKITNALGGPCFIWADEIGQNIVDHIPSVCIVKTRESTTSDLRSPISDIPPYLLLNSLDGTTPAILHTQDPVALYLADQSGTLAPAAFFRTSTDISAEGWAYWWEDAQRAFHKLTIEFMQATGLPVPQHIADAVKHD